MTSDNINLNTSNGILHPALKNKFRVRFNPSHCVLDTLILSQQIIYCGRNVVSCTLNLQLEQDIGSDAIQRFLEHLTSPQQQADPRLNIMIECLANGDVAFTDYFYKCGLIYHKFELDYSQGDPAVHDLTFQFGRTHHERGPASR